MTMMKKTTIAWLLLCLLSYGSGYLVSQLFKEDEFKTRLYTVIFRAMDDGLLTANEERMASVKQGMRKD